ncbi:MAG TPA: GntR family transcriptional regulator, partial [Pedobacter sp.]
MMYPLFSLLLIDRSDRVPVYLQIAVQLTELIKKGSLQPGYQLPGTRISAELLAVHRKTVIRAYDELLAQGWLQSHSGSGTFVAKHLPEIKPQEIPPHRNQVSDPVKAAGFSFTAATHLGQEEKDRTAIYHLDDGYPDARVAPLADLARAYRSQLLLGDLYTKLGYSDPKGSLWLREQLAIYLR